MPITKVGRPARPLKTTYRLLDHNSRRDCNYALVERTRTGQLCDTCYIVVGSVEPILLDGSLRQLAALPHSGGYFTIKASNPKAWFGPDRLEDAKAAFALAVQRALKPKLPKRDFIMGRPW